MNTTTMKIEVNNNFLTKFEGFVNNFKTDVKIISKNRKIRKDPTKFTEEEFYQMIDKASKQKGKVLNIIDFEAKYL